MRFKHLQPDIGRIAEIRVGKAHAAQALGQHVDRLAQASPAADGLCASEANSEKSTL